MFILLALLQGVPAQAQRSPDRFARGVDYASAQVSVEILRPVVLLHGGRLQLLPGSPQAQISRRAAQVWYEFQ
jgi:hypothetical protein